MPSSDNVRASDAALREAKRLAGAGQHEAALALCIAQIKEAPNDGRFSFLAARIKAQRSEWGDAAAFAAHASSRDLGNALYAA